MLSTTGQSREQLASQMKHLHTLWRNAKLKLMEKDEELDDAKDRIKTLEKAQEGHVSKISALMTVKELSVELQTRHSFATSQLEQMREENEAMRTELRMANSERDAAVSAEREATAQLKAMKSRAERAEEELRAFERRVEETEVRARARADAGRARAAHVSHRSPPFRATRARLATSPRAAQPPARALAARARAPAARDAGDAHAAHPPREERARGRGRDARQDGRDAAQGPRQDVEPQRRARGGDGRAARHVVAREAAALRDREHEARHGAAHPAALVDGRVPRVPPPLGGLGRQARARLGHRRRRVRRRARARAARSRSLARARGRVPPSPPSENPRPPSGTCRRTACAAPTGGRRSTRCGSTSARTAAA